MYKCGFIEYKKDKKFDVSSQLDTRAANLIIPSARSQ